MLLPDKAAFLSTPTPPARTRLYASRGLQTTTNGYKRGQTTFSDMIARPVDQLRDEPLAEKSPPLRRRDSDAFEGRFRSSLVEADAYLFACRRYIERA